MPGKNARIRRAKKKIGDLLNMRDKSGKHIVTAGPVSRLSGSTLSALQSVRGSTAAKKEIAVRLKAGRTEPIKRKKKK